MCVWIVHVESNSGGHHGCDIKSDSFNSKVINQPQTAEKGNFHLQNYSFRTEKFVNVTDVSRSIFTVIYRRFRGQLVPENIAKSS